MSEINISPQQKSKVTFELDKVLYLQCCDCGLVHKLDYKIINNKVLITLTRDDELTEAERNPGKDKKTILTELLAAAISKDTSLTLVTKESDNVNL